MPASSSPALVSAALRVQRQGNGQSPLVFDNIKAPKNGYCYVYVSNEASEMVYFDNLQVSHERGRIVEENHYYAYGLKITSISSKKLGDINEGQLKNGYLYNDKELFDDADLNWYDYGFRNYDPQIGRFPQLDPLTDDYPYYTPYQYAGCEPIANIDLDGLEPLTSISATSSLGLQLNKAGLSVGSMAVEKTIETVVVKAATKTSFWSRVVNVVKDVADVVTDFVPVVSSIKDIVIGIRDGKGLQVLAGVGGLVLDVVTLGGSSVVKGVIKTGIKQGAKTLIKEEAEAVIKKEVKTVYERVMSKAELDATLEGEGKNLLRGGREGENFFSKAGTISNDAKRAQQRLGLDGKLRDYKVKFTIENPKVKVSGPRTAKPGKTGTSGGGLEYSTNQATKIKIRKVSKLKNRGYDK